MSIPGVSMEEVEQPNEPDPALAAGIEPAAAAEEDDDTLVPTVQVGQQQMVPLPELIKNRKEARAAKKELAELRGRVEQAERVGQQLQEVQPLLEQLRNLTPAQRDALASGRVPSPEGTRHDAEDTEAREVAEDYGLIAADGSLDIARARKIIDKENARVERRVQQAVGPVRQQTAQQQAGAYRQQAKSIKDAQGSPLATAESIDEAYNMLPPELAAQPNVAMVAIGTAMLIDRMKGRKVQGEAVGERFAAPIYSEPSGGRRSVPALTAEEKLAAQRLGLTDKDLHTASAALSQSAGRRGISME